MSNEQPFEKADRAIKPGETSPINSYLLKELFELSGISPERITIVNNKSDTVLFLQFGPSTDPKSLMHLRSWWEEISQNFDDPIPAFFLFNVPLEQMQLNLIPEHFYKYVQEIYGEDQPNDETT